MLDTLLNIPLLKQTPLKATPFPYLVIPNFIQPEYLPELVDSFPVMDNRGSIPVSSVSCKPIFKRLVNELEGMDLRHAIAEKFVIDLNRKPTLLTLRSHVNERDGHIHTDSKSKLITLLLYMNTSWDADTGILRLLNSPKSLDDYAEEISPLAGSCLIFKVTDNCWHGHKVYVGKRLSLQLNYVTGKPALTKHLNHHRFSAWLKQCLNCFVK
jgi:SM-20-related protein